MRQISLALLLATLLSFSSAIRLDFINSVIDAAASQPIGDLTACFSLLQSLKKPNTTALTDLRDQMYIYSGHNYQDLGDYETCNNFTYLKYISVNVTIPAESVTLYFGLCGPIECDASDYSDLEPLLSSYLPAFLQQADFAFSDPTTFTPTNNVGLIVAVSIIATVLVLNLAGSSFTASFRYIDERREKRRKAKEPENPVSVNDGSSLQISLIANERPSEIRPAPTREKGIFRKICECFDVTSNYEDFMNDDRNPQHDDNLRVFNGIRVLSFCWVCFGHSVEFGVTLSKNLFGITTFFDSVWYLTTVGAFFAVDLFYFMSGFFAGYVLLGKAKNMKPGIFNYVKILIHRFLRIWPAYIICILFFWQILPWIGSGPIWYNQLDASIDCNGSWWHNALFIDNLFGTNSDVCYGWGWYLSTDFQIFLVVPIIVWVYHWDKEWGRGLLWVLIIFSICASYYQGVATDYYYAIPLNFSGAIWDSYYINPLVRASPYLIGTYLGLMYKRYKSGDEVNFFNTLEKNGLLCAIVSFLGLALSLFMVYFPRVLQNGGSPWSTGFAYTWNAMNRPLYVTGIFMFIAPVLSGNFTFLKECFGVGIFNLLSKITFALYLIHFQVLEYAYWSDTQMIDFTGEMAYYRALGVICITIVLASLLHIFVEKPFGNLETRILNPKKKSSRTDSEFAEAKNRVKEDFQDSK